jgi:hypothetical protein
MYVSRIWSIKGSCCIAVSRTARPAAHALRGQCGGGIVHPHHREEEPMHPVTAEAAAPVRPVARTLAAIAALVLLAWTYNVGGQWEFRVEELLSDIVTLVGMLLVPLALAAVLGWWTWSGYALTPQPRWIKVLGWGVGVSFAWAFGGTLLLILWTTQVQGREAYNLIFLPAFLTVPLGFLVGVVVGLLRTRRR